MGDMAQRGRPPAAGARALPEVPSGSLSPKWEISWSSPVVFATFEPKQRDFAKQNYS